MIEDILGLSARYLKYTERSANFAQKSAQNIAYFLPILALKHEIVCEMIKNSSRHYQIMFFYIKFLTKMELS